jgi:hypothetical protein
MVEVVQYLALLLTALGMGVHFGTWLTEGRLRDTDSGPLFVEVHQARDAVAARVMPVLGSASLACLALATLFARGVPAAFALSLAGLVLCLGDTLVTLRVNVPINRTMQGWQADAPPAEWRALRDRWERFHGIRTLLVVPGFALFAASVVFFDLPG